MLTVLQVSYPFADVGPEAVGGAEQIVFALASALVASGNRSLVLGRSGSRVPGELIPVDVPDGVLSEPVRARVHEAYRARLRALLRERSIDVVHYHGVDCAAYLASDERAVVSLHLPCTEYSSALLGRAGLRFVCVSRSQWQTFPSINARVIDNGVDLRRFQPVSEVSDYIACLGRICPEKGFDVALRTAREHGHELRLAGHLFPYPEHLAHFERCIRPLLSRERRFVGALGGEAKSQFLARARALAITSRVPETSSLVAMEALACGTPVIAFATGNLPHLLEHGSTGLIVESEAALGEAMKQAAHLNRAACRAQAEAKFDSQAMVRGYLELYREIALAPRGAASARRAELG